MGKKSVLTNWSQDFSATGKAKWSNMTVNLKDKVCAPNSGAQPAVGLVRWQHKGPLLQAAHPSGKILLKGTGQLCDSKREGLPRGGLGVRVAVTNPFHVNSRMFGYKTEKCIHVFRTA